MQFNNRVIAAAILTTTLVPTIRAEDSTEVIRQLKQQVESLDQKVKILERNRELESESTAEKAKTMPRLSAGAGGFAFSSADTNFVLKLRGYVQADTRFFADDVATGTSNDTFLLRRVRPILEGTVYDKFDYRVMLDFGSGSGTSSSAGNVAYVQDAYVNARLWPQLQIQAGKFKEPVGLERLQSGANLLFVERGYPTQLLPNRDVGLQLHGDVLGGSLSYAVGVFNGTANGGSSDIESADEDKDFAGRVFAHPFRNTSVEALQGLGLGVAGTYGEQSGALRSFVSPGQQRFFAYRTSSGAGTPNVVSDDVHWRITPQVYYYWGPFGLFAEYALSSQNVVQAGGGTGAGTSARLEHTTWQISASYFLTGEANSFKAVNPLKPFAIGAPGWGALEIAARVGQLDVDDDAFPVFANPASSATESTSWGLGLNWHLNRNVKLNLNYEQTDFSGGGDTPLLANGEKVVLGRVQFSF